MDSLGYLLSYKKSVSLTGLPMLVTGTFLVTVTGVLPSLFGSARISKRLSLSVLSRNLKNLAVSLPSPISTVKGNMKALWSGKLRAKLLTYQLCSIDKITIPSKTGRGVLRRIEEVFDCWFESGSMPYAQQHYPFENSEDFDKKFPADFISEGIDQTRGWFYTLLVLSTHLFNQPPAKNVIVSGLVLAS